MTSIANSHALDLAREHFFAGRLREAELLCRHVLTMQPNQSTALTILGAIARNAGRHAEAAEFLLAAARGDPRSADLWQNLGIALRQVDRVDEAVAAFSEVVRLAPGHALAHAHLGDLHRKKNRLDEALAFFERALALDPKMGEGWNNYALALQHAGRLIDAIKAASHAIECLPNSPGAHTSLGNALMAAGQLHEAIACYARALSFAPDYAPAHNNTGNALRQLSRLEEALDAYDRALALDPNYVAAHGNRALTLADLGRHDEALRGFDRTFELDPDFAEGHWNHACVLLQCGRCEAGWREYEWRWRWGNFSQDARDFPQPLWDGGDPSGRCILVHAEQGLGDAVQFVRHAIALRQRGARVIVECQESLARLLRLSSQFEQVIARGEALPAFDMHVPMLGLPLRMGLWQPSFPETGPYLRPDPDDERRWSQRLQSSERRLRVGLAWAGNNKHAADRWRSLPVRLLAPLGEIPGIELFSLQKGPSAEEVKAVGAPGGLIDHTGELHDLADTAAFISSLDLVISVDTVVAHLAGAMGKPTWILLAIPTDWRWGLEREDTEWYPSARLFRQEVRGDWGGVVERVKQNLKAMHVVNP